MSQRDKKLEITPLNRQKYQYSLFCLEFMKKSLKMPTYPPTVLSVEVFQNSNCFEFMESLERIGDCLLEYNDKLKKNIKDFSAPTPPSH